MSSSVCQKTSRVNDSTFFHINFKDMTSFYYIFSLPFPRDVDAKNVCVCHIVYYFYSLLLSLKNKRAIFFLCIAFFKLEVILILEHSTHCICSTLSLVEIWNIHCIQTTHAFICDLKNSVLSLLSDISFFNTDPFKLNKNLDAKLSKTMQFRGKTFKTNPI